MWENKNRILDIILTSFSKSEILRKLGLKNHGGNFNTLTRFIIDNNINVDHFDLKKSSPDLGGFIPKIDTGLILVDNSTYSSTSHLKKRLYREGLKERICELCGQGEGWRGKKMSLILDHINGKRNDNRLENLRIVCPNCNATLDTHCRGNRDNKRSETSITYNKCNCGEIKKRSSEMCRKCRFIERGKNKKIRIRPKSSLSTKRIRKVERPPYDVLINQIKTLGYVGTGKVYNVSDNAVRKWIKMYQKHGVGF